MFSVALLLLFALAIIPLSILVDPTPRGVIVRDLEGNNITRITEGQQITLNVAFADNSSISQPFIGLLEMRDTDGVTIFLGWQSGALQSGSETMFGMSWIAEKAGDYQIRQFALSNLTSPVVLEAVVVTNITVYD